MDMQLLAVLIALSIGVIGITAVIVKYALKVFDDIWKDDDMLIQNYLKNNIMTSHEWCVRFRAPISSHYHSIQDL